MSVGCTAYDIQKLFHKEKCEQTTFTDPVPLPTPTEYTVPVDAVNELDAREMLAPHTLATEEPKEFHDIDLDAAVRMALDNSKVMRDLGGTVLRQPSSTRTRYETALQLTDPQYGMEAALSAFDAQFSTQALFEKNDRALNNVFFGGGTRLLTQDLNIYRTEISKQAATGSTFSFRHNTDYDANNAPGNQFPHAWQTNFEAEIRQPLLQGGGLLFNRIAGPNSVPGVYRGVMVAQVNNDIAQEDFERELQNHVSEVVNAYWELYYAYRDLEGKKIARDAALEALNTLDEGAENDPVALAQVDLVREQYYRFQEDVENALAGVPQQITRTSTGSASGSFRALGGVLAAERRLRYLIGYPDADTRFLRPKMNQDKNVPECIFDWNAVSTEALRRRPELRQQRLVIKRTAMEYTAAQNFLSPRLDAVAMQRFRGLGRSLIDSNGSGVTRFDNAYDDLVSGDFQEWQVGLEFSMPLGLRRAHAAVAHAELKLSRENAILREQERFVLLELSNAIAESARAYRVSQTTLNRAITAAKLEKNLEGNPGQKDASPFALDELDARRRISDAHSRFFRAQAEYQVALKNIEYEKGSILDTYDIYLVSSGASEEVPSSPQMNSTPVPPPAPAEADEPDRPAPGSAKVNANSHHLSGPAGKASPVPAEGPVGSARTKPDENALKFWQADEPQSSPKPEVPAAPNADSAANLKFWDDPPEAK